MRRSVPLLALAALVTCGRSGVYRYDTLSLLPDGGAVALPDAGVPDAGPVPCIPGHITLIKAIPVVLFVLDRSSSMGFTFEQSTRWRALTDGLAEALPVVDTKMQLGSITFPLGGSVLACTASASLDFVPAIGNAGSIVGNMRAHSPSGSTPTAAALDIAGPALINFRASQQGRALVLATDGAPDCNEALDPATCTCVNNMGTGGPGRCEAERCLDDVRTVARVAHLADAGLPTYVVGIQNQSDMPLQRVLNAMAIAGGRPQVNAATSYYAASSKEQLDKALVTIRDQIGACVFLARSVPDRDEAMTVTLMGTGVVPYDPTGKAGWAWSDKHNGELYLAGPACDEIIAAGHAVLEADVACEEP